MERTRHVPMRTRRVAWIRLLLGTLLILGSVSSVTLLWVEGYSPRGMIVLGLTLMLTSACGMWFAVRGRWD